MLELPWQLAETSTPKEMLPTFYSTSPPAVLWKIVKFSQLYDSGISQLRVSQQSKELLSLTLPQPHSMEPINWQ
jgi:hypothetical protein